MTNLQLLSNTNPEDVSRNDIHEMFNTNSANLNKTLESEFRNCDNVELLKSIAILHEGYDYQYSLEDVLIEKMGEDEYNEFADENDF